jgi:hypothetical protein
MGKSVVSFVHLQKKRAVVILTLWVPSLHPVSPPPPFLPILFLRKLCPGYLAYLCHALPHFAAPFQLPNVDFVPYLTDVDSPGGPDEHHLEYIVKFLCRLLKIIQHRLFFSLLPFPAPISN